MKRTPHHEVFIRTYISYLLCAIAQAQAVTTHEPLLATAPIRKAATKNMKVAAVLSGNRDIVVYASLSNIQLVPGPSRTMPNREYKGDWFAFFNVVPKLDRADAKRFLEIAMKSRGEILVAVSKLPFAS